MQRAGRRPVSRAESEYEEIGPARDRIGGGSQTAALPPSPPCDLCGNPNPFVRCSECLDQNFCAACDEMYHKHPKRSCHVRKPLSSLSATTQGTARVEMPGSGPVAPPRSSRRKGAMSAEPSPAPSRTSTLPRKPHAVIGQNGSSQPQNPMAGRPLPPPPPVLAEKGPTPPPVLPKKSASVSHMAGMMTKQMPGTNRSSQPGIPMPVSSQAQTGQWSQQPTYPNQPGGTGGGGRGTNPYPSFGPNGGLSYPRGTSTAPAGGQGGVGDVGQYPNNQTTNPNGFPSNPQYPTLPRQPPSHFQNNNNNSNGQFQGKAGGAGQYPGGVGGYPGGQFPAGAGQYPRGGVPYAASEGGQGPSSKYLDEEPSVEPPNVGGRRSSAQVREGRGKGRFANRVVNRSSSMHDLARNRLEPSGGIGDVGGEGVRWQDEQARLAGRTTSTASLHMLGAGMPHGSEVMWGQGQLPPGSVPMWGPGMPGIPGMPGAMPGQPMQPFHPMVGAWPGQAGVGMMPGGQVPLAGQQGFRGSMHELNRNFLRPTSPIGSEKSTRSKKSNRSNRSNGSKNSTRRSKSQRNKENGERRERRTGSNSKERGSRNNSKNKKHRESSDEDSEDFFTGESDEEFVSISSNSDKAPRVSWTCEHCTYVNNPGVKVCAMCCKTSKNSREVVEKRKEEERKKKEKEKKKGNRRSYHSSDGDSDKDTRRKGKSRKDLSSDSEDEKRRRRRDEKKKGKSGYKNRHSSESELDEDAVAAYYAVRIDKSQGMTITAAAAEGRYGDSSSESASAHNPRNLPVLDAPAPAKGILKKANSNLNLAKADGMSEVGTISEVGYITNKLTQRLKARGQHDVLDSPDLKGRRTDTSSDDIWQQEKENWLRQKEELKAWAAAQGGSTDLHKTPASPRVEELVQDNGMPGARMYRTLSGFSLGDAPETIMSQQGRRGSEQVAPLAAGGGGGKRSFRSKRFSRNLDPSSRGEQAGTGMRRAQSFHIDQREDNDSWLDSQRRSFQRANSKNSLTSEMFGGRLSDSDSGEEGPHFTSTVTSSTRGPGGVGSYLARQEFGSSEVAGQPGPDSGYVSHSSGGGYPKLQVPMSSAVKSFTMSMDRGFLGGPTKPSVVPSNPNIEFNRFRSMEDLGPKQEKTAGWELVRLLREAEKSGFTSEDVQVAVNHCGEVNPIAWLTENWGNMIETVMTLASNVGHEAEENTIGTISKAEAREALRKHKGNIWASVTECVEGRQQKYDELASKGNFSREDIVTMLTAHEGSSDAAFQELNKAQLKPFLMRIWGQAEPGETTSGAPGAAIIGDQEEDAFEDAAEPEEKDKIPEAAGGEESLQPQPEEPTSFINKIAQQPGDLIRNVDLLPIDPEQQKFERQVRRYLAEGKVKSYEQGELVVKLLEKEYGEEEVFIVIKEATTEEEAVALLRPECELCASVVTIQQVVKMPSCEHFCCQDCAKNFFTLVVTDQNISQAVCPFCREPTNLANDDDAALAYYAKLDLLLKPILDQDTHDLFQRKLRDRTLMKDPNFKWCYKCPFGFLADPKNKKLVCPDCRAMSCAKCLVPWEPQHEGISCADFARWKEENNPDTQAEGVEAHLAEHGISCPACNFRYTLTKGGCMHFTCTQCKYEFCIGCNRPFKLGTKCGRDPGCAKLGLHAHHPRNCLFYLRDKEPADLQKLLKKNKVEYLVDPRDGDHTNRACRPASTRVQVQKETENGMEDGICGEATPTGHAGYCKTHYVEYLCGLVIRNKLEVVSLMELGEVKAVFTRAGKFIPRQRPGEYEFKYLKRLAQMVEEEVPLDTA